MKARYYKHFRGGDIKPLPKLRVVNDAAGVFTIAATWLSWSWIWRFPDTKAAA